MAISKEAKIGIVAVIGIGLLVWGVTFLKGKALFDNSDYYYAVYKNVGGLSESSPVTLHGLRVGSVTSVRFMPEMSGKLLVKFSVVEPGVRLPYNTIAQIESADLLGTKAIVLQLGDSDSLASSGDTLNSFVEKDLENKVLDEIAPLKIKAVELLASVDSVLVVVQSIFSSNFRDKLDTGLYGLSNSMITLQMTSQRLDSIMASQKQHIEAIFANAASISTNLKNNNEYIALAIKNLSSVTDSLAKSDLKSTINNANRALYQLADVMEKINKGEGSLGSLVNNDTLYINLENAAYDLDRLLQDMKMNPGRYVHFSIFGRKEKARKED